MRANVVNFILFLIVSTGCWFLWSYAEKHWIPKPPPKKNKFAELTEEAEKKKEELLRKQAEELDRKVAEEKAQEARRVATSAVIGWPVVVVEPPSKPSEISQDNRQVAASAVAGSPAVAIAPSSKPEAKSNEPVKPSAPRSPPPQPPTLIAMGDPGFNLQVLLTTRGGAVQQVVLTKFDASDRLGREVKEKDQNGNPTKKGVPLYLIPGEPLYRGRFLQDEYHPPELKPGQVRDLFMLAEPAYNLYHYATPEDKYPDPFLGETNWKVVSEQHPEGAENKVVFEAELGDPYFVKFRKTYTLSPGDYHIGFKLDIERLPGGQRGKGLLRYQISGPRGLPLEGEWYTSTYRVALIGWNDRKGTPRRQYEDAASVAIKRGGEAVAKGDNTFKYMAIATQYFASGLAIDDTAEGAAKNPWAYVRATTEVPLDKVANPNTANFDDMTVRAVSDILDLEPNKSTTHSYVIYNGPAKVRLLGLMGGDRSVDPALVERYREKLGLQTITDFHSPSWLGSFANSIWWSDLVITFTNVMHWLLSTIQSLVQGWAMSIVILTIMVRLILVYPSRKQTQMNLKMVEIQKRLAPQIEELKKRCGDDFNEFQREKMRLMMANGMNPAAQLGGCLLLLFQMPVMMGLYFCLQESIFFRLEPFLWIQNLAAPDMTLWWSEKIPYISTPEDLGSFLYLGPYLNILPLIAVGLMIWQQSKVAMPPADPNGPDPQKMMKYMMIMMAVMFYKVAAGLALYFIVGSLWGMAERRYFIKKAPPTDESGMPAETTPKTDSPNGQPTSPDEVKPKGWLARKKEALKKRLDDLQKQAEEQARRQIRNAPDQNRPNRDRKKKRRK